MPTLQQTPQYLVPQMDTLPVSSCRYYQTATITGVLGNQGPTTPIDAPLAVPLPGSVAAGQPAIGVRLTHRQEWVIVGTALGPLLHSVCLAPGEITQIAVRNQSRQVAERSVDSGIQLEDTTTTGDSTTAIDEAQRTNVGSSASGGSVATSGSATVEAGAGGLAGLIGVSAGGSSTLANSNQAAVNTGTRSVADQANQTVHQLARDQAQLSRTRSTASVREVAESDGVEINTRVIANYNHMHALTMQYFEVEQVYQLRTRITDAERLLFVPMRVIDFSDPAQAAAAIGRYRNELMAVAADLGLHHVVAKLAAERLTAPDPAPTGAVTQEPDDTVGDDASQPAETTPQPLPAEAAARRITALAKELDAAVGDRVKKQSELDDATDAVAAARDALRKARDGTLVERSRTQRGLQQSMAAARAAEDRLLAANAAVAAAEGTLRTAGWEQEQRRLAAELDDEDVRDALDAHRLAVNQGLWLRLDPSVTAGFLQRRTHAGDALGDTVDPTPVAVSGHLLGFPWRFRDPAEEEAFVARHTSDSELAHSVSMPTGGLFGEAVLGTSNGAERIDLTRFWNWKDALPPIRPAQIATQEASAPTPLNTPSRAGVPNSQLPFRPVEFLEAAPTLPAVAALLASPELFRDISGQQTTAALAQSAMELSAGGASTAAQLASDNFQRFLTFQHTVASTLLDAAHQTKVNATMAGGALNAKQATDGDAAPAVDTGTGASGKAGVLANLAGALGLKPPVGGAAGGGAAGGAGGGGAGAAGGAGPAGGVPAGPGNTPAAAPGGGAAGAAGTPGPTAGGVPALDVEFDVDAP